MRATLLDEFKSDLRVNGYTEAESQRIVDLIRGELKPAVRRNGWLWAIAVGLVLLAAVVLIGPDIALAECTGSNCGEPADSGGGGAGIPPARFLRGCGLGFELAFLLPLVMWWRRRVVQ
jgi:hypothetical protein